MSALSDFMEAAHALTVNTKDMIVDGARAVGNSPGAVPLWAAWRQGADELAQIVPAFPDGVRPQPEIGAIFEVTPGSVDKQANIDIER